MCIRDRAEGGAIGFIEEIDAIGGARHGMGSRGEDVYKRQLY